MFAILTVVLYNQNTYTDGLALGSLADELSLTISQAQAYGIAVRELTPGSADFTSGYGLSLSLLESQSNKAYISFIDRNGSEYYDGDWSCAASECLEKVLISRGNYIDSFCVVRTQGADQCGSVSRADISFLRPNTEARLFFFNSGGQAYSPPNLKGIRVVLKSPAGLTKSVTVYTTGQVSVQ